MDVVPAALVAEKVAPTAAQSPPAMVTPYSPSAIAALAAGSYTHMAPGASCGPVTTIGVANCAARRKRSCGVVGPLPAFWTARRVVPPFTFFCTYGMKALSPLGAATPL